MNKMQDKITIDERENNNPTLPWGKIGSYQINYFFKRFMTFSK